jgi:hypothetical protein
LETTSVFRQIPRGGVAGAIEHPMKGFFTQAGLLHVQPSPDVNLNFSCNAILPSYIRRLNRMVPYRRRIAAFSLDGELERRQNTVAALSHGRI